MAEFKDRFKQLRLEKDLSQEDLATDFNAKFHYNFGKSSISMYENNKRMPEINALEDFATYFNVSVDYLLGRTDVRNIEETKSDIHTIAAHHDGDDYTEEELNEIEAFKKWVKARNKDK